MSKTLKPNHQSGKYVYKYMYIDIRYRIHKNFALVVQMQDQSQTKNVIAHLLHAASADNCVFDCLQLQLHTTAMHAYDLLLCHQDDACDGVHVCHVQQSLHTETYAQHYAAEWVQH